MAGSIIRLATLGADGTLDSTQVPASIVGPFNALAFGAKGDGVTDDTAAIQAAINAASNVYTSTGRSAGVILPRGYGFLTNQLIVASGVHIWAYDATIVPSPSWTNHGLLYYPNSSTPQILSSFEVRGGNWQGSGNENSTTNQMVFQNGTATGMQDCQFRGMRVTNWGATSLYLRNATRCRVSRNTILCNGINNSGFQNEVMLYYDGGAPASGQIIADLNFIHNATADAIAAVFAASGPASMALHFMAVNNVITADPPTADASCTFTNGSAVINTPNAAAANVGRYVTASIAGVTAPVYIGACTPGVSYTLYKAGATVTFTGTSGPGTLYIGVYKSSIKLELDGANAVSNVLFANNDVTGYERELIGFSNTSGPITLAVARNNVLTNGQINAQYGTGSIPQGTGIQLHSNAGTVNDIDLEGNKISLASAVPPISRYSTSMTNNGRQTGNKFSTGPASGTATLVAGTATVSTAEIQAGDIVVLSRQTPGGTLGELSVGTITAGTSFVISSSSATETSTVYWKIDH